MLMTTSSRLSAAVSDECTFVEIFYLVHAIETEAMQAVCASPQLDSMHINAESILEQKGHIERSKCGSPFTWITSWAAIFRAPKRNTRDTSG